MNVHSRSRRLVPSSGDWRMQCRELLQMIWNHNDSEPFREPVDCVECPGNKNFHGLVRNQTNETYLNRKI